MIETIDIADLDVIFLTYDEPKKDEFWVRIQNIVPWAKRVDGVKGSDAAHKAAADASSTERFILIDGDNIPEANFFNLQLTLNDVNKDCVFRWKARNNINGLMYGNGGISCWTKQFAHAMRTHEATDGRTETLVEFCFDPKYIAMHDCYSMTYPNATAFQAWRAGFREGVKMCLDRGSRPSVDEFRNRVNARNYDHLSIWHNIGRDVENGDWAIYGARLGTYLTMLTEWDYTEVQDFDKLENIWKHFADYPPKTMTELLGNKLGLQLVNYDSAQSKFFKHHYKSNYVNKGPMVTEMEVIRQQEGW